MDYFSGVTTISVDKLEDILLDMSQDTANILAIGPQEEFMTKLEIINRELRFSDIDPIDVTRLWNWKPGSYDKMKELINLKLFLNKKSNGMDSLLYRTYDRMNYLNYIKRQASDMEHERHKLKHLGVSSDVDIEKFKEGCIQFVNHIKEQQNLVSKMTNNKVTINSYLDISSSGHNQAYIYFDVLMVNLTMNIFQGRENNAKCIQKLPLEPLHIIIRCNFRHLFNGMGCKPVLTGKYLHDDDINQVDFKNQYLFPFISSAYNVSYGSVCLDGHMDEVYNSIKKKNLVSLSMALLNWAQYYNTSFANPYTQPNLLFLGLPKGLSKEFITTLSQDGILTNCVSRVDKLINTPERRHGRFLTERFEEFLNKCDNANCTLREQCKGYIKNCNSLDKYEDLEYRYKAESIAGWLLEQFNIKSEEICKTRENVNLDIIACDLSYYFEGLTGRGLPTPDFDLRFNDINEEAFNLLSEITLDSLIFWQINTGFRSFQEILNICYDYGWYYWDKEEVKVDCKDESEIAMLMKQWASSSGRSDF
jgi:hypothetical protein